MDIIFNCPGCQQELEVDARAAGNEISCPACNQGMTVPSPDAEGVRQINVEGESDAAPDSGENAAAAPAEASNAPAAATQEDADDGEGPHFTVRSDYQKTEILVKERKAEAEEEDRSEDGKTLRVRTIRHADCIEVGKDKFDAVVTKFLNEIGEPNIVSINTIDFTTIDISTQKLLTDYGVLIIYRK